MARKSRPEPTLADYMAIAIGPALIIVLVGSIAFFLLTLFYSGELAGVTRWTMGCFVVAAVLISRVSINEGSERAAMFGLALMGAVGLAMLKYTDRPIFAWLTLGVIWAFASHLVWNCTLIDDAEDASGEGLLEAAGLDDPEAEKEGAASGSDAGAAPKPNAPRVKQFPSKKEREAAAIPPVPPPPPLPMWKRLWNWWQRGASRTAPPGIWVIYCSLVALPIFGFGQLFISKADRPYAFQLMFRYVAAALLLLLTTSFLGLRRYLRQRRLEMPLKMAGVWLGVGGVMVAAILLLAFLIPRPNPDFRLASLANWITSPKRDASKNAVLKESTGEGESNTSAPANEPPKPEDQAAEKQGEKPDGKSAQTSPGGEGQSTGKSPSEKGQPPADGKQPAQPGGAAEQGKQPGQSPEGKQAADGESSNSKQGEAGKGDQGKSSGEQQGEKSSSPEQGKPEPGKQKADAKSPQDPPAEKQPPDKAKQKQQAQQKKKESSRPGKSAPPPKPATPQKSWTPSFGWLGSLIKFLFYLIASIVIIYFLIRYWADVRAWLLRLWQEFLDIWNNLFGKKKQAEALAAAADEEAKPQPRPFASYKDPFLSGDAARSKPSAVVQYSFEALEAWAIERGVARQLEETPLEFAGRLAAGATALGPEATELALLYARVAYARDSLSQSNLGGVERLWQTLRRNTEALRT